MTRASSASGRWTELDGKRSGFIRRCERLSQLTLRKICPEDSYDQETDDGRNDWQSVGATAVNHMANRLMLTMFAPSRPNFRLEPTPRLLKMAADNDLTEEDLAAMLSQAEHKAARVLDKEKARPRLYEILKHLIVTGNGLLRRDDGIRVMGLKNYCARRSISGKLIELVIKETLLFDEIDTAAQEQLAGRFAPDDQIDFYIWCKLEGKKYKVTQWVDEHPLSGKFIGDYAEKDFPYHAITWDLSDRANYGTGLVEEYAGEFEALSSLSEAMIGAAILASEFRWLANPAGMTSANDLLNSENGSVLPGVKGDIEILHAGKMGELDVMMRMTEATINRIGRGFLLNSAVTRDAERVTAEEIRLMAQELETGHGGVYSRLSIDLQEPIVYWELSKIEIKIDEKDVEPIIITGLDALSRNGDLENLKLFLADCGSVNTLPPAALGALRIDAIYRDLATGRGLISSKYVKSQAEAAQEQAQAQQSQVEMTAANAAAQTAGENIASPQEA